MYWPPYYYPPYPPQMPMMPQQAPSSPVEKMTPRDIKRAIRFHQKMIEQYEADKKKKEDGKKKDGGDKKPPSTFTALQWMALLIMFSPLIGLTYLKVLASLASSIPH